MPGIQNTFHVVNDAWSLVMVCFILGYIIVCRRLIHWGRVTHICISKLNHHWFRSWPVRHQAIIWTNYGIFLLGYLRTNLSEFLFFRNSCSFIQENAFENVCEMATILSQPQYINDMMTSSNGNLFRVTGPLCGEFTGPGEFSTQRPVTRSFDVFFDLRLNKRLSKHTWGWWFEPPSWSLWRHRNGFILW